jgi:hypothetical protein
MHEKPEPTPLGWPILPRHNQPFTPPIPSKHQCATQPILQITTLSASYVPGVNAAYSGHLYAPAMSRGVSPPAYSGTERFGINPVANTSQSNRQVSNANACTAGGVLTESSVDVWRYTRGLCRDGIGS